MSELKIGDRIIYTKRPSLFTRDPRWVPRMDDYLNQPLTVEAIRENRLIVEGTRWNFPKRGFVLEKDFKVEKKVEKGMLKCINPGRYNLTKDKEYKSVIDGSYAYVINDKGVESRYSLNAFEPVNTKEFIEDASEKFKGLNISLYIKRSSISCGVEEFYHITSTLERVIGVQKGRLNTLEQRYYKELAVKYIVNKFKELGQRPAYYIASCNVNNKYYDMFKMIMEELNAFELEERLNKNSNNKIVLFIIKSLRE